MSFAGGHYACVRGRSCITHGNGRQWRRPKPRSKQLKIDIYDQSYNVNAEDEEYIKELAAYVDTKMREVADATHMVDSLKVAVLAALNITDEMFRLRERQEKIEGPMRKRVERCATLVEKALEHAS
jgi:cell division protein ZapA (FtsZ GTPase activity inhibitor)